MGPLNPESLSSYGSRTTNNRNSAYSPPEWAKDLASGLPSFNSAQCNSGVNVTLDPKTPESPAFQERVRKTKFSNGKRVPLTPEETLKEAEDYFSRLKKYAFAGQESTSAVPAPPCTQQAQVQSIYGSGDYSQYQHTFEQTGP